jgi:hypothetical protein
MRFALSVLALAAAACGQSFAQREARPTSGAVGCGKLVRWAFPASTLVEQTAEDRRTEDELMTQARIANILVASEAYCVATRGTYPTTFEEISAGYANLPDTLRRCELEPSARLDAWERPIFFSRLNGVPVVRSAGADGIFSTRDDIGVPDPGGPFATQVRLPTDCE